jgi:hypothetical protein
MEYYSLIKNNEMMSSAGKWMELLLTILGEISQAQKTKCFHSYVEFSLAQNDDKNNKGGLSGEGSLRTERVEGERRRNWGMKRIEIIYVYSICIHTYTYIYIHICVCVCVCVCVKIA